MRIEGVKKDWHKIAIHFPDFLHRPVLQRNLPESQSTSVCEGGEGGLVPNANIVKPA